MLILTPDAKIKLNGRSGTSDEVVVRESFIENVYQLEPHRVNDTGVIIDIGANIGAFSLYAANMLDMLEITDITDIKTNMRIGGVYAYEPQADNYKLLCDNVKLNGMETTIKPINMAVGGVQQTVGVTNSQGDSRTIAEGGESLQQVKMITLEQVFADNQIAYCDVLKIDIEGGEYELLKYAEPEILAKVKYLTMEFHGTTAANFGRMVATLSQVFNLHIIGSYDRGGQIYGNRY